MASNEETRLDQMIRELKNRPSVARVFIFCLAIIGLGQITGALTSILGLGHKQAAEEPKHEEPKRELTRKNFIYSPPPDCLDNDQAPPPEPVPLRDAASNYWNLALLRSARANASSSIESYGGRHQIAFLNDGWYNNCRSWIPGNWVPGQRMSAWGEVDLGAEYKIFKVALGSEHTVYYGDRTFSRFDVTIDGNPAVMYNDPNKPIQSTTSFILPSPIIGQVIRVSVPDSAFPVRIDEVEVYGTLPP